MRVLVTGVAGFIGYHLARRLLADGHEVAGIDNLNAYYDVRLKKDRLAELAALPQARRSFCFQKLDLADGPALERLLAEGKFSHVVNLAAQAGVRYSLVNPKAYVDSNLTGFATLLEGCRKAGIGHLVYASSSSVYGLEENLPHSPRHAANHPASLYAATKKANEAMAHAYSHIYRLPCTGLRFFTVYGPFGRPDMAPDIFTRNILSGAPIRLFNGGRMRRDFTYIDDITESLARLLPIIPEPDPDFDAAAPDSSTSSAPWRLYNIGNSQTIELGHFLATLEKLLGKKALVELAPMQPGDVQSTWADVGDLQRLTGFAPATPLEEGLGRFVRWYRAYYRV